MSNLALRWVWNPMARFSRSTKTARFRSRSALFMAGKDAKRDGARPPVGRPLHGAPRGPPASETALEFPQPYADRRSDCNGKPHRATGVARSIGPAFGGMTRGLAASPCGWPAARVRARKRELLCSSTATPGRTGGVEPLPADPASRPAAHRSTTPAPRGRRGAGARTSATVPAAAGVHVADRPARAGLVDRQRAALVLALVQRRDGGLGLRARSASRPARSPRDCPVRDFTWTSAHSTVP